MKIKQLIIIQILILLTVNIASAVNETEAMDKPIQFLSSLKEGIFSFITSTIGGLTLFVFAVGIAGILVVIGKSVGSW